VGDRGRSRAGTGEADVSCVFPGWRAKLQIPREMEMFQEQALGVTELFIWSYSE
jgi:hypothetical protein